MKSPYVIKRTVVWAIILTVACYFVAVITSEMAYLTNDDGGIQSTLSGFTTGEPYPFHQFISVIISFPIAGLYKLFPGIQWWYVWSQMLTAVGIFLTHYYILKFSKKHSLSFITLMWILVFLDVGFFIYPIANISFTIVPAMLGTGIVSMWFFFAEIGSAPKHFKVLFAFSFIAYILLFAHRRTTGLVMLCYILLAFFWFYMNQTGNKKKRILHYCITVGIYLLITVSMTALNHTVQYLQNGVAFEKFNSARSQYMDYPHDSYDENPEIYAAVGWDADVARLVSMWCFLDEDVTAEAFTYLSENSENTVQIDLDTLKTVLKSDSCRSVLLLWGSSIILAIAAMAKGFRKKDFCVLLLNNIGTIGLLVYQILSGRAIYRSIIVVLLPATVINIMLSIRNYKSPAKHFRVCMLLLGLICVVPMLSYTFDKGYRKSVVAKKQKLSLVDEYLEDHPDNFYVVQFGVVTEIDPWRTEDGVSNSIRWGGSTYYSSDYYRKLSVNGLTELTGMTFVEPDVYFISSTNATDESYDDQDSVFGAFYRWLQNDYGVIGFVLEDKITDGAYVYHFIIEENVDDYCDEICYDIEDGVAVQIGEIGTK